MDYIIRGTFGSETKETGVQADENDHPGLSLGLKKEKDLPLEMPLNSDPKDMEENMEGLEELLQGLEKDWDVDQQIKIEPFTYIDAQLDYFIDAQLDSHGMAQDGPSSNESPKVVKKANNNKPKAQVQDGPSSKKAPKVSRKAKKQEANAPHPTYINMITAALKKLKNRKGTSRQAILR